MQIKEEKQKLRKKAAALRSSVGAKDALSRKIAEKLFSLDVYLSCEKVFAYFSYSQEVQTEFIIEKALADGKKVALPRCESSGAMSFYYIESAAGLEKGTFKGILEPKANAEKAEADEKTLVIVPALAYGRDGTRLGHGMGYYDRFLSVCRGKTIGLCFEKCLFKTLPQDGFDRPVSVIITENEILSGSKAAQT